MHSINFSLSLYVIFLCLDGHESFTLHSLVQIDMSDEILVTQAKLSKQNVVQHLKKVLFISGEVNKPFKRVRSATNHIVETTKNHHVFDQLNYLTWHNRQALDRQKVLQACLIGL